MTRRTRALPRAPASTDPATADVCLLDRDADGPVTVYLRRPTALAHREGVWGATRASPWGWHVSHLPTGLAVGPEMLRDDAVRAVQALGLVYAAFGEDAAFGERLTAPEADHIVRIVLTHATQGHARGGPG